MRHSLLGGTEMFDDKISWLAARCIVFPKHQADNFIIYLFLKHQMAFPKDLSNSQTPTKEVFNLLQSCQYQNSISIST